MGLLDHVSYLCSDFVDDLKGSSFKHKKQPFQTVEIKIRMDCEGCERKVRRSVEGMKGVTKVEVEPKRNKLTVSGFVDPKKVLKRVRRKTGKPGADLWPYVPYELVYHPYVAGTYDKKAPHGYVRNVDGNPNLAPLARASSLEEKCTAAFSDDNPNSCSVM